MIREIKWHFNDNWPIYIVASLGVIILAAGVTGILALEKRSESITHLAEGRLVVLRNTGAFSIYDMELKFEDGSLLLMTYSFCRSNNIREGRYYKIWQSSYYGFRCKEIENGT